MTETNVKVFDELDEKRQRFLRILEECLGNNAKACAKFGVERQTVYYWIENTPGFKEAFKKARTFGKRLKYDALMDVIEEAAVVGRDWRAAVKMMQNNFKNGISDAELENESWTQRVEHTGKDGKPMEFTEIDNAILANIEGECEEND